MRDGNTSFFITVRDPALALGTRRRFGGVDGGTIDVAAVAQCRHRGLSTFQTPLDHRDTQQQHSLGFGFFFVLCFKQHFLTQDGLAV